MVNADEDIYVVDASHSSTNGSVAFADIHKEVIVSYNKANHPNDIKNPASGYVSIPLAGGKSYHFAMSGKTFGILTAGGGHPVLPRLLSKCTVYARMSPDQKQLLIEKLQELGYYVGESAVNTQIRTSW
jgi:cation-transporting ATPase 13A3/4/5